MDRMAMDASAMTGALMIALAAGAVLGAAHLASLWWSVALLRDGRTILGFSVQALRFVALALALALIARHGALPLIAAAASVLAVRALLMGRYRRIA
jgi:N-ATPase, AtpR subunit